MIELLLKYPPVLKDARKSTIYRCFLPHRCQCLEDFPTDRTMFGSAGRGSWVGFFLDSRHECSWGEEVDL